MNFTILKNSILSLFILVSFMLYFRISIGTETCQFDCFGYITLMGKSIFSQEYWHTLSTMFRSFTIPVIYSLFGAFNPVHHLYLVYFQTLFAFFSWLIFSYAIAGLIKSKPLDSIIFVIFMLTMFGRGYYIYNQYLWSESLALSFLLLWYAIIINSPKIVAWISPMSWSKNIIAMCFFCGFTLAVACTRDTNALIILFAIPLLFKPTSPLPRLYRDILIIIILYISIACQINASFRHQVNMLNIITGVVLNDPEKRDFFAHRGMPVDEKILQDKAVMKHWDFVDLEPPWPFLSETRKVQKTMGNFLSKAKIVYTEYLLLHPEYLAKNMYRYRHYILDGTYLESIKHLAWGKLSLMDDIPLDCLVALALISLLLHYMLPSSRQREKNFLFYSAIFMLAGLTNAAIAFHGDFWEVNDMQRHAFIGSIFFKMGCTGMILGTCIEMFKKRTSVIF